MATKFYAPVPKNKKVSRPRLLDRLEEGARRRLTLISASAGAGKSSLLAEWIQWSGRRVAWLSLDEDLRDSTRLVSYLIGSLRGLIPDFGAGILEGLASPFPPGVRQALESLVNELSERETEAILVLDDYHRLDSEADETMAFLLDYLPPGVHLVLCTREDPTIALSRLRANGELTELRMADLQFTPDETRTFFHDALRIALPEAALTELHRKTEGWIAGLQLAAVSMAQNPNPSDFVRSFAGTHRFVLDYLVEEVLKSQSPAIQDFLLTTSVLDRFCGDLCDSVLGRQDSQQVLEALERDNLFIVPLDSERTWFRYHQLFADMLRVRGSGKSLAHQRASLWLGEHSLGPEAFRHAVLAQDIDQAEKLIESGLIPTHEKGIVAEILAWLDQLSGQTLEAHPRLLVRRATLLLAAGQTSGVEDAVLAAERFVNGDLLGQLATARATVAATQYQPAVIAEQAQKALSLLNENSLAYRFMALSALGFAKLLHGQRTEAEDAYQGALAIARRSGDGFSSAMAFTNLGQVRELENDLAAAAQHYRSALTVFGDHPQPYASESLLGLARVHYQTNDLDTAEDLARQSLGLAKQYDPRIDRFVLGELLLARIARARGDAAGSAALLSATRRSVLERGLQHRLAEISAQQIEVFLLLGDIDLAEAEADPSPASQVRIGLARRKAVKVLPIISALREETEGRQRSDELVWVLALEALVLHASGDLERAGAALTRSLDLAGPSELTRVYLDEGEPMRQLLLALGPLSAADPILRAFDKARLQPPGELLSTREREVLRLVAQGLSNLSIAETLFLALDTVKGHNRRIFEKLQASSRTEAIAKGRELGLL